jgi:hypothetical protein
MSKLQLQSCKIPQREGKARLDNLEGIALNNVSHSLGNPSFLARPP